MKIVLFIGMIIVSQTLYSQKKMLSDFKLLYSIPQEVKETDAWPKYGLESLFFENDTLYTLLVKKGHITAIPLSGTVSAITNIPIPVNDFPFFLKRYRNIWYTASVNSIMKILSSGQFQKIVSISSNYALEFFDIVNDKIIYTDRDVDIVLTDMNGKELHRIRPYVYLLSTSVYGNKIFSYIRNITVGDRTLTLGAPHTYSDVYKNYYYFVGGCGKHGYYVNFDQRDHVDIWDMTNMSQEGSFSFNHLFSAQDQDFPEEDDINLRVLSEDNRTFYFVQVKNGHLDIYKGVR